MKKLNSKSVSPNHKSMSTGWNGLTAKEFHKTIKAWLMDEVTQQPKCFAKPIQAWLIDEVA